MSHHEAPLLQRYDRGVDLCCVSQFFQKRGVSEALSIYELFNAVSGLNVPFSEDKEEEFLTEVGGVCGGRGRSQQQLMALMTRVCVCVCVSDHGAGEEERGPCPETEKEKLCAGARGRRSAAATRCR